MYSLLPNGLELPGQSLQLRVAQGVSRQGQHSCCLQAATRSQAIQHSICEAFSYNVHLSI